MRARPLLLSIVVALAACEGARPTSTPATATHAAADAPAARVRALADRAAALRMEEHPEVVTYLGLTSQRHDRLSDRSPAALRRYHATEDELLAEARAIDPEPLAGRPEETLLAVVRESLEGTVGARVCHEELWPVNQANGFQAFGANVAGAQPMGTPERRAQAVARWRSLPRYIDQEILNARDGLAHGYSSPKRNVSTVIGQLGALASADPRKTPFFAPAERDGSPEMQATFEAMIRDEIQPALRRYRAFLEEEYLSKARDAIGVSALPEGRACYDASVRRFSTRAISAADVHALGLAQVAAIRNEASTIALRALGTADLKEAFAKLAAPPYTFRTREEVTDVSRAALDRARAAMPRFFGIVPRADVVIKPAEPFRERSMVAQYIPAADDGSRPGTFVIVTYDPEKRTRATAEATAFHEGIPGHHLQLALAAEQAGKNAHLFTRLAFNPGFMEGWALYSEHLADEMGLYATDVDRIGMLSSQLLRAARLVVDSGMHALGWTRDQCVAYFRENTVLPPGEIESEIDRYAIWPGQASSYMLGMLEIRAIRAEAERTLGPRFDVRAFHDRVLDDGAMPLAELRKRVQRWTAAKNR
jgi:uncharacterized protein (DUF885 family)